MGAKQLPVVGLILALFFGARTANRTDASPAHPVPIKNQSSKDPGAGRASVRASEPVSRNANGCRNGVPDPDFTKSHWWMTQQSSQGCSLALSPVWREICKINPIQQAGEQPLATVQDAAQFKRKCLGESASVQSMMAAVPNPQRTHLGLMTDRAIEAIQVAASEARFLPLSHYLPWPTPSAVSGGSADSLASNASSDSADPGVLIFRDVEYPLSAARPNYLLVFLIPEVPTEGLDRGVFIRAATMIEQVSPQKVIRLAGPNFSGSIASLRELEKGLGVGRCIHAVSGSVTNAKGYVKVDESCSTFNVTQTGDREALCEFVKGAGAFGYRSNQIAILSEEGTQYGRQGPADEKGDSEACTPDETPSLWFLHFPREISKLRNAYGAAAPKAAATDSSSAPTGLGLKWQDAEAGQRDDLQTYGELQTPLSQEAVLSSLSITLKAQGIKALGVLATDPMDEAFLIHSLRESSPDVRLFVRDPDLLFLRTPDVGTLNGTLLVSNYPLVPQNQFWSSTRGQNGSDDFRERHLITFPSAFQEGEYNAFVELIDDAQWSTAETKANGVESRRLEWEWPAGVAATQEASAAGKPKRRPLWLATIGTAGHYPISILNYHDVNRADLKLHSLELGPPQFLPMAFWAAIAMLGVLQCLGLRYPGAVPSYFKLDFDVSDRTSTVTLVRIFCHVVAILTMGLAQMILGSSYLFFYASGRGYSAVAICVAGVTAFLAWTAGVNIRKLYILSRQQERMKVADARKIIQPKRVLSSSIVASVILVGAGILWGAMTLEGRFNNAFLHFRDLNLSSGVAPTLPLASVLLVMYFGVWAYLRRLSYWEHRYVEMFNLKLDQVIRQDLSADVKAIDTCLLGPLENWRWIGGFLVVMALSILAFRPWTTLDMIEPSRVSRFALFFLVCAILTLWLNWFRFINIWVHLRNVLEHLENLPIRTAFQRLPREKSLPILHWSSSQNSFLLRQVLDRLRALARVEATTQNFALQAQFESRIDALMGQGTARIQMVERRLIGGSPTFVPTPSRRREDHQREARQEMTNVTEFLSTRLRTEYWTRGSSGTEEDQKPKSEDLKYVLAEDIVALPFYAYIRKVVSELRNILFFLGVAVSLLFAALHTYAFRADQAIDWWFFGLFASMGGGIVVVIAQMERNALLNRLSDGTPGELGRNFYVQLLKYGAVPFLTIFGSQVPSISNVVLKWVQPALEALH